MKVLGALLAGGQSRRFGSDKAAAMLDDRTLMDHAIEALAGCDTWVMCGRERPGTIALQDRPRSGLGPLGGLCAALEYGEAAGFDAVLAIPCDVPDLPHDLLPRLRREGTCAYLVDLPVAGLWPCALAAALRRFLDASEDRSLRAWARQTGAVPVDLGRTLANINTVADLTAYRHG
jgi:molybdenum cofactor guanylyltransferase